MKPKPKSAFMKALPLVACAVLLGACDNVQWPHVYGPDEVPQSLRDAPRAITMPPPEAENAPYPRLGDVPSHPKTFSSPTEIDNTQQQMEDDREEAKKMKAKVDGENAGH